MQEQSLSPETDQPDGLDSVNPPFALSEEDEADSTIGFMETPPQPPPAPRPPLVVGTRRRAPAPAAYVPAPATGGTGCADLITAIFLLMTIGVCAFTMLLVIYPRSPLNPFPAPPFATLLVIA